ncbi:MAG: hypothetical protein E6L02_00915 [Thaumarchaeota archaeon]|nr:MAG: hypothetical protein E6L02_00915 [Nitrososphaerota archaeon]
MASIEPLDKFLNRYRDMVFFNKNLIIAGVAGFFSGALGAQLYSRYDNNSLVNAIVALLSEYSVDIPFFAIAFYVDNRFRYHDPITGKKNTALIKQDIKKLVIAISASEAFYAVTKIFTHYQFLHYAIEPYQAAMASSLIAWTVFIVLVNVIGKRINLFHKSESERI